MPKEACYWFLLLGERKMLPLPCGVAVSSNANANGSHDTVGNGVLCISRWASSGGAVRCLGNYCCIFLSSLQKPIQQQSPPKPTIRRLVDVYTADVSRKIFKKPPGGKSSGVLVVEDLQAGDGGGSILGFCGAIDNLEATSSATAATTTARAVTTYISLRAGQEEEIDELTASLLARALRGWLGREAGGDAGWHEEEEELAQGGGEMVDWVDTKGRVICALPRPVVHSRNVLHRGAGVMIRNDKARRRRSQIYTYLQNLRLCTFRCRVDKQHTHTRSRMQSTPG